MVAYIDDFKLMMLVILVSLPLLFLIKVPKRVRAPAAAPAAPTGAAASVVLIGCRLYRGEHSTTGIKQRQAALERKVLRRGPKP